MAGTMGQGPPSPPGRVGVLAGRHTALHLQYVSTSPPGDRPEHLGKLTQ